MNTVAYSLRQHLLTSGADTLSDVDLLSIVMDSPMLARSLNNHHYIWSSIGRDELSKLPRFNDKRVSQMLAIIELSGRILSKPLAIGKPVCCSADVANVYKPRLTLKKQESFIVLALDNKNRVIAEQEVHRGTLTQIEVHPREVFRALIRAGAAHAIMVHNHPSGDPTPSHNDKAICKRLNEVGEITGIKLLDFIIVGANGSFSLRDMDMMQEGK